MTFYERIRQEHWLRDKQDEGKGLILNDDSIWEVHPSDQSATTRWLRGSTIIVEYAEKEGYPYLLRNRTEEETARATAFAVPYINVSVPQKGRGKSLLRVIEIFNQSFKASRPLRR